MVDLSISGEALTALEEAYIRAKKGRKLSISDFIIEHFRECKCGNKGK